MKKNAIVRICSFLRMSPMEPAASSITTKIPCAAGRTSGSGTDALIVRHGEEEV